MAERGQESSLGLFIYLFTFGCTGSLMLFAWAFSSSGEWGLLSTCGAWASHCSGFSCCEAQVLGMWASVVVARRLSSCSSQAVECRLSSCGPWAYLAHSIRNLPRPWIKPVSPVLAGRLSSTAPPGKSCGSCIRALILFTRAPPSSPTHFPEASLPTYTEG